MIKTIIIAVLAISATKQACDIGCLKCNSTGDCLIPDILNSYYLSSTTATKTSLSNCALNSVEGKCVACNSGYYLDSATSKCVSNPTVGITNCSAYSSATSCSLCKQDYYLNNNACVAVETKISNCEAYAGTSTCSSCANTYLLSLDSKSCVSAPSISNCGDFTFVKCNTCASGYVLNPNNYLESSLVSTSTVDKTILAAFAYYLSDSTSESIAQDACQVESTENCALFDQGTNTCTTCSSGYYLDATTVGCIVFPDEPLENCQTYTSVNTCSVCVAGYYFKSGICTQITGTDIIANCSTYKGDKDTTTVQCSACAANYYLSNNTCVLRTNSVDNKIANCATKNTTADLCAACSSGFVLASDYLYCFTTIANCSAHESIATGQTIKCKTCSSGYYLTNTDTAGTNSCLQGTVTGCNEYPLATPGTCNLCQNKYVLSAGTCTLQVDISKCDTYSSSETMTCLTCTNPGYFNFFLEKYCQNIPTASKITGCNVYTGDLTSLVCAGCTDGLYLTDAKACVATNITNCTALNGSGSCISCKTGFAVAFDGKSCVSALSFVTDNCLTNSTADNVYTEDAGDVDCKVCQNGAIPFDQKNYYVCISYTEAAQYTLTPPTDSTSNPNRCIKYDSDFNCVQCDVDSSKPYLETDKTCTASCNDASYKKYIYGVTIANDNDSNNILQLNVCFAGSVTGCEVYAPDLVTVGNFICIKCQSTYIDVLASGEVNYSNADPSSTTSSSFFPSAFAKFPKVSCIQKITITQLAGVTVTAAATTAISNCSYYLEDGTAQYSCLRCNMGFIGTITTDSKISACTRNTDCAIDKYYNLDAQISNLASCHKCSSGIPFIAYQGSSGIKADFSHFTRYSLTLATTFTATTTITSNIACRNNSYSTFTGLSPIGTTTANAVIYKVASNCGLAVLIVNSNGTFVDGADAPNSSYGIFCAACAPGYKPTLLTALSATYPYIKTACTAISNCATTGTYFNACSACNSNYILSYSSDTVDFTTCLAIPAATSSKFDNCLAASPINTTNAGTCQVCKTGFFLNDDSVCERYQPTGCNTTGFIPIQKKSSTSTLDWSLALNGTTIGCNKCSSGIAYKMSAEKITCMKSDWVSKSVDTQTSSNYIRFCKYYEIDNSLATDRKCQTCSTSYVISGTLVNNVPTTDGLSCFTNAAIANCAIAKDASTCLQCSDATFSLKSNKCELGNIANCAAYNYNLTSATVTCSYCAADYYRDTDKNSCSLGQVHNCKKLSDNNSGKLCDTCQDGYVKVSVDGSNDYCYPKDTSLGCNGMAISNDSTYGGRINCSTCTDVATQAIGSTPTASTKTICMAHHLIANCKSYGLATTILSSTFRCTECNSGFYLSASVNRCVARTNQPAKCTVYKTADDTCDTCDSTSYLSNSSKACTDYPKGIVGCRTYSNATTCTACKDGRYLSANACPKVTTAIANCQYYSSNTTCSLCSSSYALINNACVKATASNCATYTSDTVCATCASGYVLQTTNSVTNCVAQTKTGCASLNVNSPYNCIVCTGSYYLEASECKIATVISNCAAYDSKTTCSQCNKSYALSADKTACVNSVPTINYIDSQCSDSQISSTPVCSRCDSGFYFVNGACTGTCNSGSASGCLACNPKSATTCYVCKSGYYQSKDGVCNANSEPSSVTLVKGIFTVLVALVALMF